MIKKITWLTIIVVIVLVVLGFVTHVFASSEKVDACVKASHTHFYVFHSNVTLKGDDFIYAGPSFSGFNPIIRLAKKTEWCNSHIPEPTEEVTPTITPEATSSATPSNQPKGDDRGDYHQTYATAPGAATCNVPFSAPIISGGNRINGTTVEVKWWKSTDPNIDFQAIIFGYASNQMTMGALPIDKNVTALDITQLHNNAPVFVQVWAFKGGCASLSNVLEIK